MPHPVTNNTASKQPPFRNSTRTTILSRSGSTLHFIHISSRISGVSNTGHHGSIRNIIPSRNSNALRFIHTNSRISGDSNTSGNQGSIRNIIQTWSGSTSSFIASIRRFQAFRFISESYKIRNKAFIHYDVFCCFI